jgi:hypothetical protein
MTQQLFRLNIGECVATPRGAVAEIVSLTSGGALIRYLGTHRHLGEMELQGELLRPATAHDLVQGGIHSGDPSAPKPRTLSAEVVERERSRRQPHGDEHNKWRSARNLKKPVPRGDFEADCLAAVAAFVLKQGECHEMAG